MFIGSLNGTLNTLTHLGRIDAMTVRTREGSLRAFDGGPAIDLVAVVAAVVQSIAESIRFDTFAIAA